MKQFWDYMESVQGSTKLEISDNNVAIINKKEDDLKIVSKLIVSAANSDRKTLNFLIYDSEKITRELLQKILESEYLQYYINNFIKINDKIYISIKTDEEIEKTGGNFNNSKLEHKILGYIKEGKIKFFLEISNWVAWLYKNLGKGHSSKDLLKLLEKEKTNFGMSISKKEDKIELLKFVLESYIDEYSFSKLEKQNKLVPFEFLELIEKFYFNIKRTEEQSIQNVYGSKAVDAINPETEDED